MITRAFCLAVLLSATSQAGTISTFNDRSAFSAAACTTLTVEDFTSSYHFEIWTGVLNSRTDLSVSHGLAIKPGDIQEGVTYTSPTLGGTWNCHDTVDAMCIDEGDGFHAGFLTRVSGPGTPDSALTATFDSPVNAFGFDTNSLMGTSFNLRVRFTTGPDIVQDFPIASDGLSFFGFVSDSRNVVSASIYGEGSYMTYALDNFTFTAVPEPSSISLGMVGLAAVLACRATRRLT